MNSSLSNNSAQSVALDLSLVPDVKLAQIGDIKAFERLLLATRSTVSSIALAVTKDLDSGDDVTQQVYISVWQQLKQLKNPTSFLPWIRQITRYTALNYLRDNKISRKITGDEADKILADFSDPSTRYVESEGQVNEQGLDEVLIRQQQSLILNQFIEQLPDESREIVLLFYREEQSSQQVANLLGLSADNVRQKLSRVRKTLKTTILERHGRILLSTLPGLTLSSSVIASISSSTPIAAATLASSLSSGKIGFWGKLMLTFGTALSVLAITFVIIFWWTKKPIKLISDQSAKRKLIKLRNLQFVWMTLSLVALMFSSEFTEGWQLSVFVYLIFVFGLHNIMRQSELLIFEHLYSLELDDIEEVERRKLIIKRQSFYAKIGWIAGLTSGFAGLLIGMIERF